MHMVKSKFFMGKHNLTCDKWQKQTIHMQTKNKQDKYKHTNKKLTRQSDTQINKTDKQDLFKTVYKTDTQDSATQCKI